MNKLHWAALLLAASMWPATSASAVTYFASVNCSDTCTDIFANSPSPLSVSRTGTVGSFGPTNSGTRETGQAQSQAGRVSAAIDVLHKTSGVNTNVRTDTSVGASVADSVTISHGSLAVGTPVTLRMFARIDLSSFDAIRYSIDTSPTHSIRLGFSASGFGSACAYRGTGFWASSQSVECGAAPIVTPGTVQTFIFDRATTVGSTISLNYGVGFTSLHYFPIFAGDAYGQTLGNAVADVRLQLIAPEGGLLTSNSGFDYTPAGVPEPASWTMMIAGFGLLGAAMRRRRQTSVLA